MQVVLYFALASVALALCSNACLGECALSSPFEICLFQCECRPLTAVNPDSPSMSAVSPSGTPQVSASQPSNADDLQALPSMGLLAGTATVTAIPSQISGNSQGDQFKEQYRLRACGLQCVSLCEKLQRLDCIEPCEAMFCLDTRTYTFEILKEPVSAWPWWLLGRLILMMTIGGLAYLTLRRLPKYTNRSVADARSTRRLSTTN